MMTDPLERRIEAMLDHPIPGDLERRIDARVQAAITHPSRLASVRRPTRSWGLGSRRRLVLVLATMALVIAGGATLAGNLLRTPIPPANPALSEAMEGVRLRLMAECLDEAGARQLVAVTLRREGVSDWRIRTDGPVSYPVGEREAYVRHTDRGCYVYGGNGWDADGRPVYYIGGPGSV